MNIMTCPSCNGTGIDTSHWSGECQRCDGWGEVEDADDDDADPYDDEDAWEGYEVGE